MPQPESCLAQAYLERTNVLMESTRAGQSKICTLFADRYRPLANVNSGNTPLEVLTKTKGSGIETAKSLIEQTTDFKSEVEAWAKNQKPPITLSAAVKTHLGNESESWSSLEHLPDTNLYAFQSIQGSADCNYFLAMQLNRGVMTVRKGSPLPGSDDSDETGDCGTGYDFGRIDTVPTLFNEAYDGTPRMTASVTITTWHETGFIGSCMVTFSYKPKFTDQTLNDWLGSDKPGAAKDDQRHRTLHAAALELVAAVQDNPGSAADGLNKKLSQPQSQQYQAALKLADQSDAASDPADYTDEHPLHMPFVYQGQVLMASLGHFTIGWRTFADWSVLFQSVENGKLVDQERFAIGMLKGDLVGASVTSVE